MASPSRIKLGELFIQHGLATPQQVEEAVAAQVIHAGRIGSNLVELHYVDLNTVSHFLSQQLGVPAAEARTFDAVDQATLALIPKDICVKHKIFPLALEGKKMLHLAMLDPHRLEVVDHLSFALGYHIRTYVTPQLRLLYYLELHYGVPRPKRYLRPPERETMVGQGGGARSAPLLQTGVYDVNAAGTSAPAPGAATPPGSERRNYLQPTSYPTHTQSAVGRAGVTGTATARVSSASMTPTLTGIPIPQIRPETSGLYALGVNAEAAQQIAQRQAAAKTQPDLTPPPVPGPSDPVEDDDGTVFLDQLTSAPASTDAFDFDVDVNFDADDGTPSGLIVHEDTEIGAQLDHAASREEIVKALVQPCFPQTTLSVLFLLRGDLAVALGAWGTALKPEQVRTLVVPTQGSPSIRSALAQRALARGRSDEDPVQRMVANYLRASPPVHHCVVPILVSNRVVNFICLQAGEAFPPDAEEKLLAFAQRAAAAYARLIREQKGRDASPP